jgi:hypothetical protein
LRALLKTIDADKAETAQPVEDPRWKPL